MKVEDLDYIRSRFEQIANEENAYFMAKYMKNNFAYYGIKSQARRDLQKELIAELSLPNLEQLKPICRLMMANPERELFYFAIELCEKSKKHWTRDIIDLFEEMIGQAQWWDSIDTISVHLIGEYFLKFPEEKEKYARKWIASDNFWINRVAIIFQLKYKSKIDQDLLFEFIKMKANEKEFFIRKAIGWALREYSKTSPKSVIQFVEENQFSGLSNREALRLIKSKKVLID